MNSESTVWLNGEFIPSHRATVPLLSHGFSRGSAIFEVFGIHASHDGLFAFRIWCHFAGAGATSSIRAQPTGTITASPHSAQTQPNTAAAAAPFPVPL